MLEELGNGADGEEGLVLGRVLALGVEDVRADDGRQIGQIHLAARLLVDVGERGDPFEEDEDDLHRVAVRFGQQAADEVEDARALFGGLDAWRGQCGPCGERDARWVATKR